MIFFEIVGKSKVILSVVQLIIGICSV